MSTINTSNTGTSNNVNTYYAATIDAIESNEVHEHFLESATLMSMLEGAFVVTSNNNTAGFTCNYDMLLAYLNKRLVMDAVEVNGSDAYGLYFQRVSTGYAVMHEGTVDNQAVAVTYNAGSEPSRPKLHTLESTKKWELGLRKRCAAAVLSYIVIERNITLGLTEMIDNAQYGQLLNWVAKVMKDSTGYKAMLERQKQHSQADFIKRMQALNVPYYMSK